ncbi:MAG TPA: rhodanese-like domain-containing protein [Methylomirabilota bacterium]|nr:rhodanese-like domain-containing protein [Methylomirabilota bacterium]
MREVDHREVLAMLSAGAQIVDVLPAQEYNRAHVKGAVHIPLPRILADAPRLLDRSQRTVVYCRDSL